MPGINKNVTKIFPFSSKRIFLIIVTCFTDALTNINDK